MKTIKTIKFIPVRVERRMGPEITVIVPEGSSWADQRSAMREAALLELPNFEKAATQGVWEFGVFQEDKGEG